MFLLPFAVCVLNISWHLWIQRLVTVFKYYRLFDNCTVFSKNILDFPQTHMSNTLPGDCQHHWSSFIWEVVRAFMGFKRIIKVHIYCELFNFCMCLHNCYCAVLYNSARNLPVSTVSLEAYEHGVWRFILSPTLVFLLSDFSAILLFLDSMEFFQDCWWALNSFYQIKSLIFLC